MQAGVVAFKARPGRRRITEGKLGEAAYRYFRLAAEEQRIGKRRDRVDNVRCGDPSTGDPSTGDTTTGDPLSADLDLVCYKNPPSRGAFELP